MAVRTPRPQGWPCMRGTSGQGGEYALPAVVGAEVIRKAGRDWEPVRPKRSCWRRVFLPSSPPYFRADFTAKMIDSCRDRGAERSLRLDASGPRARTPIISLLAFSMCATRKPAALSARGGRLAPLYQAIPPEDFFSSRAPSAHRRQWWSNLLGTAQ